ncbi:hypothetical protein L1887_54447 [Cichorium endivia]|nr:hypothetical protein L1887_54447 [Cichorium endivia]
MPSAHATVSSPLVPFPVKMHTLARRQSAKEVFSIGSATENGSSKGRIPTTADDAIRISTLSSLLVRIDTVQAPTTQPPENP